jgi:uncharacterized RDD family membrane protein YckC
VSQGRSSVYASFSRRVAARFIDLCFVLAPCGAVYLVNRVLGFPLKYTALFNWQSPESATMFMTYDFPGIFVIFTGVKLLLAYPYFALMESSRRQATLGKQLMQIKVTDTNGARISFARATGRYFLKAVSSFEFMLGYVISFSDQRQTWHDYMARTLVVRSRISFSAHYLMPKIPSPWMFDVPFASEATTRRGQDFACIWCDYQSDEERLSCPNCGRTGYVRLGALRGILLMCGSIFTIIGCFLLYTTIWVTRERLADDALGREGTPIGVIFIIFLATALCLGGGLSSVLGRKWFVRLILAGANVIGGRSFKADRRS